MKTSTPLLPPWPNADQALPPWAPIRARRKARTLCGRPGYPDLTLKWLRKHARSQNEFARWNVAMVWSAVGGRKYAEQGMELLTELAADPRRFVWRAAASAAVKLGKARPEIMKPILKQWRADPQRRRVAAVVSRYL
jgi:hypothetical protein